jgi:hypothetical protein
LGLGGGGGGGGGLELALPLGHAGEVAGGGGAGEDPLQFGVGAHRGLVEDGAAGWVEADGEEGGEHFALVFG